MKLIQMSVLGDTIFEVGKPYLGGGGGAFQTHLPVMQSSSVVPSR